MKLAKGFIEKQGLQMFKRDAIKLGCVFGVCSILLIFTISNSAFAQSRKTRSNTLEASRGNSLDGYFEKVEGESQILTDFSGDNSSGDDSNDPPLVDVFSVNYQFPTGSKKCVPNSEKRQVVPMGAPMPEDENNHANIVYCREAALAGMNLAIAQTMYIVAGQSIPLEFMDPSVGCNIMPGNNNILTRCVFVGIYNCHVKMGYAKDLNSHALCNSGTQTKLKPAANKEAQLVDH